jgi:hypothetical protein
MKYKITDSQLESVIFLYLDNQDFIRIERDDKIYFANSEGDEYAQIRYDKKNGWCYISWKFVGEISSFFSLDESDSEQVIGRWVENTLQMRVTHTFGQIQKSYWELVGGLRIPYN